MATSDAPISIGGVTLVVNDLGAMVAYYARVIGLNVFTQDAETATLGVGDRTLITLHKDAHARRRPQEAGLFHTAFLLPKRTDLSDWLHHTSGIGVRLDGAGDHGVSEALYLHDPEGNGIEVYCDRPRSEWTHTNGVLDLGTNAVDMRDLVNASDGTWAAAPTGTVIGHVHLQVNDVASTDQFMADALGMEKMKGMPSAGFYSTGGYHHHLAGNIWKSRNGGPRSPETTGLAEVELLAAPDILTAGLLSDPAGIQYRVSPVNVPADLVNTVD